MQAFYWFYPHPQGVCDSAVVMVAAERRSDAARRLRSAGWHGVKPEAAQALRADDAAARLALDRPGQVMWRAGTDDDTPSNWHDADSG